MHSIQTKFILLILSCVWLCSSVIGGAGILNAQQVVDADSARMLNLQCKEQAGQLNGIFSRIEQSVMSLSSYLMDELESVERLKTDMSYLPEYTKHLESVAINSAKHTEGAVAVYIRFNPDFTPPTSGMFWSRENINGDFVRQTPTDLSAYNSNDTEHVGWYYIPIQNGKPTWISPYQNRNINICMISYVIPLYYGDEVIGVAGMDIDFQIIEQVISSIQVYQSGYAFLTDAQNNLILHPKHSPGTPIENLGIDVQNFSSAFQSDTLENSLISYQSGGQDKRMAFYTLENGMQLILTAPAKEIDEAKNNLVWQIVIASLVISAFSVLLTAMHTRRIVKPLRELNIAAEKIAAGDMSISLRPTTKDEAGTLTASFQVTVNKLEQYISYINGLAYRDALTGVKNKTAYQEAVRGIEEQMRTGRPQFAVAVMDINNLKAVNDSYGHDFGDMLIMTACKLICKVFAHSPVYRIGGDEFVVILQNSDYENYIRLLENFQNEMDIQNSSPQYENHVIIARGVAVYSSEVDLVFANVFQRADEAMYQNKAMMKAQMAGTSSTHDRLHYTKAGGGNDRKG